MDDPVTIEQADAVGRAVSALITWRDADRSDDDLTAHLERLRRLTVEDAADGVEGRLLLGLVSLAGQLLVVGAELAGIDDLAYLEAIAAVYLESAIFG